MAQAINTHYIPFGVDHDPRIPPIGRIVSAFVKDLDATHKAVVGQMQVWEKSDVAADLEGDGRIIASPREPAIAFEVLFDKASADELGRDELEELARVAHPTARPRYHAKKAFEPISSIVLEVGIFVLGAIAAGFLAKVGEGVFETLKARLSRLARPRQRGDRIFQLQCGVTSEGRTISVDLIATNPTPETVQFMLTGGLQQLDALVARLAATSPREAKIAAECSDTNVRLLYSVRDDGVPSPLVAIEPGELERRGLSMGGIAEIDEHERARD
jgi:hypothetical protein